MIYFALKFSLIDFKNVILLLFSFILAQYGFIQHFVLTFLIAEHFSLIYYKISENLFVVFNLMVH